MTEPACPRKEAASSCTKGQGAGWSVFKGFSKKRQHFLVPVSVLIKSKSFQWGGGVAGKSQLTQGPAGWGCIDLWVWDWRGVAYVLPPLSLALIGYICWRVGT